MGLDLGYRSNWRPFDAPVTRPLTKPSSCEACSAFTRVAACTLAQSPIVTANRRLQPFRYLHDCSDCFRLEPIAGWASHPLESAAFSRRTPIPAVRVGTFGRLKSTLS